MPKLRSMLLQGAAVVPGFASPGEDLNVTLASRQRLLSLDALRGFDMVWLIGLAAAIRAFCGAFPGGDEWWLARQMHHCSWEGFRFYDLIFPLFLFMAGVSFPFSYASQVRRGVPSLKIHMRLVKRVAVLVALQLVQSGIMAFDPEKYRYPSVLVRIALPWFLASLVYIHLRPRARVAVAVGMLAAFWGIMTFWQSPIGAPGADNYAVSGGIIDYLDGFLSIRSWIGHDPFEMRDIPLSIFSVPLALGGMASLVPCGGFVLALGALFFAWLFLWLLYRANIFIKA